MGERTTTKAIPEGMHTVTPHVVVRGAARAAEWYGRALGAVEKERVPVPGGKLITDGPGPAGRAGRRRGRTTSPTPGPAGRGT